MNRQEQKISNAVIRRLPRYLRVLEDLKKRDVVRISSGELSDMTGYTASQIRQDLNHFGGFGQQGYGYNIADLKTAIESIMGIDRRYSMVIVGCGRLGQAIANFISKYEDQYDIKAVFDIKESLIGESVAGVAVRHQNELAAYLSSEGIDIGVITAVKDEAQNIADTMVKGCVRGIWNFVPVDISVPETVTVENIHISDSLHVLTYNLNHRE